MPETNVSGTVEIGYVPAEVSAEHDLSCILDANRRAIFTEMTRSIVP